MATHAFLTGRANLFTYEPTGVTDPMLSEHLDIVCQQPVEVYSSLNLRGLGARSDVLPFPTALGFRAGAWYLTWLSSSRMDMPAGAARLLADLMVGTKTEIVSEPYSVTR